MSWLEGIVRNIFSHETNPNRVLDVRPENYANRMILFREEALVLYGSAEKYEIVLHRPCSETLSQVFSLFRSENRENGEARFIQLKDKVPVLVETAREVCNLNGIQKLCDAVQQHPSWTAAHLAAHFGLDNSFNNPYVLSQINVSDTETGASALQVAILSNNLKTVKVLVSAEASLEHLDYSGNNVFHYAAETSKEIIQVLSSASCTCLNSRNVKGYTPLHVACLADKPECVKALVVAGADVNIEATQMCSTPTSRAISGNVSNVLVQNPHMLRTEDMKFGGTPLHWSSSREVINTLIDECCDINAVNFDGRTALHIMALRNRFECVVTLLSRNADPKIADKDGNTPLHLAVRQGNIPTVQALIVFGADVDYNNNEGVSARHIAALDPNSDRMLYVLHAVGAVRCNRTMNGCTPGCSGDEQHWSRNGTPPPPIPCAHPRDILDEMLYKAGEELTDAMLAAGIKKQQAGGRLLSLDGGGIRGLILVVILLELEKAVGIPIIHCFDWIAGTSTGGILTLGLAAGKTLRECLCMYFALKEQAFVGWRPYASEPLERVLMESLGKDNVMADIVHPKIMVTGVLSDRKPVDLHLFRNYECASSLLNLPTCAKFEAPPAPEEQKVWRVARATGAAPSYFRAFGRFLDGGLISNNPTLDAMTEIHEYNLALRACGREAEARPLSLVVSVGTGLIPLTELKGVDVFRPEGLWGTAKLAMGMATLGALLIDQATASDGRVVDRARAWCSMIGVPYFRLTPQMSEDISVDEKNDEKLVKVLWETKAYMYSNQNVVKKLASVLNTTIGDN